MFASVDVNFIPMVSVCIICPNGSGSMLGIPYSGAPIKMHKSK